MKHTWKWLALAIALALLCVPAAFAEVVQPVVEPGSSGSGIIAMPHLAAATADSVVRPLIKPLLFESIIILFLRLKSARII